MIFGAIKKFLSQPISTTYNILTQGDCSFEITSIEEIIQDETYIKVDLALRSKSSKEDLYDPQDTEKELSSRLYPGMIVGDSLGSYKRKLNLLDGGYISFNLEIIATEKKNYGEKCKYTGGMYRLGYKTEMKRETQYFDTRVNSILFKRDTHSICVYPKILVINVGNMVTFILTEGQQLEYSYIFE